MASETVTTRFDLLAKNRASRVFKQVADSADDTERRFGGLGKTMAKVGRVAAIGLAAGIGVAVVGMRKAVDAASDLGEVTAATSVIFGKKALPGLQKFAAGAATALGQSQRQALDAANTFATFGKSAGLSGKDLSGFSTELVTLSSDLASFKNTSPEEAITAIGAALRGESEPIRRYGVLLDDASLRQEALKQGLIKTTKEALTPQQKVLAAQALILKQTTDAQGDFGRTSGGLANQQRILRAQLENVSASIGRKLLPFVVEVVTWINERLPGAMQFMADAVDRVKTVIGGVVKFFQDAKPKVQAAFDGFVPRVAGIIDGIKAAFSGVGGGLIASIRSSLAAGDWKSLGQTIADGISRALAGGAGAGAAVSKAFAGVDWLSLGKKASAIAVPFIIGFVNDLVINFLKFIKSNPVDAFVFVTSFIPFGRVAGFLAKFLGKLPIVGPILRAIAGAGGAVEGAFGAVFRGAERALSFVAPALVRRVKSAFDTAVITIYSIADDAWKAAKSWALGVGRALLEPFAGMVDKLFSAGANLISGFIRGIASKIPDVQGTLQKLTSKIPDWKGPADKDRKLLIPAGRALMDGLNQGIVEGAEKVRETLQTLTQNVAAKVGELKSNARDMARSVADSVRGIVDIGALGTPITTSGGLDADGNQLPDVTTTPRVTDQLSGFAAQAKTFADALARMANKGVAASLIAAVAAAGPVGGMSAAQALASGTSSDIASVNASIGAIDALAKQAGTAVLKTTRLPADIKREEDTLAELRAVRKALEGENVAELRLRNGDDLYVVFKRVEKSKARRK